MRLQTVENFSRHGNRNNALARRHFFELQHRGFGLCVQMRRDFPDGIDGSSAVGLLE